jgi:hypothetical protein
MAQCISEVRFAALSVLVHPPRRVLERFGVASIVLRSELFCPSVSTSFGLSVRITTTWSPGCEFTRLFTGMLRAPSRSLPRSNIYYLGI